MYLSAPRYNPFRGRTAAQTVNTIPLLPAYLVDPDDIIFSCPAAKRHILEKYLSLVAFKKAIMYNKLGQKKIAVELLDRFCQKEKSMRFGKNTVGAVVFPCGIGGLGIVRSLGQCGIPIIAVDSSRWAYGLLSRYCYRRVVLPNVSFSDELVVESLVKIGSELPNKFILYPEW